MEIKKQLSEKAAERAYKWNTEILDKLPDVDNLQEISVVGSYSITLLQSKKRLIHDPLKLEEGISETPSAIARDYLTLVYKRGPRATTHQINTVANLPPAPNYADPGIFAHGAYVDIKSCYWSIMNLVGWNVDYNPGLWLSPGRPPYDYPFPDHKVGRNCLNSAGRAGPIPLYDPRALPGNPWMEVKAGNRLLNYNLPRLIHDILNSIASQAIEAGGIYCNNDGFIAPNMNIAERIRGIISDWGLESSIKAEGDGEVKASGTYQVGSTKTLTFGYVQEPKPLRALYPPVYRKWLQKEFTFFASQAQS